VKLSRCIPLEYGMNKIKAAFVKLSANWMQRRDVDVV
jgi:hypothetical protein